MKERKKNLRRAGTRKGKLMERTKKIFTTVGRGVYNLLEIGTHKLQHSTVRQVTVAQDRQHCHLKGYATVQSL
jgi:hypothetical protein